jgi:hypothetical protein
MGLALYMDQHVPKAITVGLRLRNVDELTAYEDGAAGFSDPQRLDRAQTLQRVLFTQDDDLLREATQLQKDGTPFFGIIYAHQLQVSIGTCIRDLELIAAVGEPADLSNQLQFLPL